MNGVFNRLMGMQEIPSHLESDVSDSALVALARAGGADARAELFGRHLAAATRLAARLGGQHNADDLVSESFSRVFAAMDAGGGPDFAFRPYLLATVRNTYVTYVRTDSRHLWVDDLSLVESISISADETELRTESSLLASAFRSLPERWQIVLWHTAVEQESPAEVAVLLGTTPGAVAALSFRAREGLRQAYLAAHMRTSPSPECAEIRPDLPVYVRGRARPRLARRIEGHLDECYACALVLVDLEDIGANLGAVLAPAILGMTLAEYLTVGKIGLGLLVVLDKFRLQAAAATAVVAVGVAAALTAPWNGPVAPRSGAGNGHVSALSTPAAADPTPSTPSTTQVQADFIPPGVVPHPASAESIGTAPPAGSTPPKAKKTPPGSVVRLNVGHVVQVHLTTKPPHPTQSNAHQGGHG